MGKRALNDPANAGTKATKAAAKAAPRASPPKAPKVVPVKKAKDDKRKAKVVDAADPFKVYVLVYTAGTQPNKNEIY